ncbi:Phosphoenolpyruvate synthase/pyruvate phosphate dikinase [Hyella patelloides LEGE 07179]|uniref:Phosphoenolpyruvate synthase/pyruvate phosphate dikinase n=1 Tax=Hyella patelloides LEGE 07179 TaxID=945734 RepID=A0A563VLV4_9CYAN|nr:glycerol-3-phosphate acyltransferase [Hyella patelloides]VEP12392.1 Phosphoenolpyruvate synthase/pyruvate phosphate dikinase [Hyella patelloides LEGE 07179]
MDSTFAPIWGSLIVFIVCPLLGGLPLIDWITYALTGRQLTKMGTGNVSVSAAFYHGGKVAGILAVISEAAKGIIAVLLTRMFFPRASVWELLALIGLVMGRYWMGKGAGTTNVTWGILAHDIRVFAITILLGGVSFTINRDRQKGKIGILVILAIVIGLFHPNNPEYWVAAISLSGLLWWIYQQIPDDLDLSPNKVHTQSSKVFRFFQAEKNIVSLDSKLDRNKVGSKAANLALVKGMGYTVPDGWVLSPGEDAQALVNYLQPSPEQPLVVRSSALDEDSESASAAGQYLSILHIASKEALKTAILDCQASYLAKSAQSYRQKNQQEAGGMAVLVQEQIAGVYSGVAFSRDPVNSLNNGVAIEALPGNATKVVSGKFTPQRYQVILPELPSSGSPDRNTPNQIVITPKPDEIADSIPRDILESVALLAREMEEIFRGTPQDIEWTHDGEQLWLLQVRPITTLETIWTRKIASEVIPGQIHPLTWSINQPLTCGVWGELFTIVLGKKARDLDFNQTATLHYDRAYFNASLLGNIFLRMGLPPESLEFLTRGEKFSKPPIISTIKNIPGLWRLLQREWQLETDFKRDYQQKFEPLLTELTENQTQDLTATEIIARVDIIIEALEQATYYSILAPLSFAIRQGLLKVSLEDLDNSQTPEITSMQALAIIAADTRKLIAKEQITMNSCASLFAYLAENTEGESILNRFNHWLAQYGYLGDVATDIAIPRWLDNPRPVRQMFSRFFFDTVACEKAKTVSTQSTISWLDKLVQTRLNLKGKVSEVYNKLLAHLRWSLLVLETTWLSEDILLEAGDIFFLKLTEIKEIVANINTPDIKNIIDSRKQKWEQESKLKIIPYLVYGNPDTSLLKINPLILTTSNVLSGIGTSQGQIEGTIKVVSNLQQNIQNIDKKTILVVPYTDAGWSPLLALAGGLIAEVGGRLSHGAIIAREYGIPAVMDIPYATQLLHDGKKVRINGQTGIVEILD